MDALSDGAQLHDLLLAAGFHSVSVTSVVRPYALSGEAELWGAVTDGAVRGAAMVAALDEATKLDLRARITRRLEAFSAGGSYNVTLNALIAVGTR